jgi:hypothetical protein
MFFIWWFLSIVYDLLQNYFVPDDFYNGFDFF